MKTETKFISPALAEALLSTNPINRAASYERIKFYEAEMNAGQWVLNGQGIVISLSGKLLDGQKRMHAIIRHGKPVEMLVISDVVEEAFKTLDSGQPRSTSDAMHIAGIPHPNIISAAAGLVWKMVVGADYRSKFSPGYALKVYKRYPAVRKWIGHVVGVRGCPLPQPQLLAAIVYFEDIAKNKDMAEAFFAGVTTGSELKPGNPILALRNRLFTHRANRGHVGADTLWPTVVQVIDALEEGKALTKVSIGATQNKCAQPSKLSAHLAALLATPQRLSDLTFVVREGGDQRKKFQAFVQELRNANQPNA